MTRRTRITLAAAAGLMLSLDALGAVLLVPPALRSLDSGRARSWLQTSSRVSRALSRAALVVEKSAVATLADRIERRAPDFERPMAFAALIPEARATEVAAAKAEGAARRTLIRHRRQHLRLVTWSGACCGKMETTLTQ